MSDHSAKPEGEPRASTHLLIYGDSNTHGILPVSATAPPSRLSDDDRWAGHLARGLGTGWRVTVEGLPGRTCALDDPVEAGPWRNGLTVLPAILHSHKPIDIVAIMLGTNDQKARYHLTAQDIALSLARLVAEARFQLPGTRIMVICPPAVRECGALAEMFGGTETRFVSLPHRIADMTADLECGFFDANTAISVDPEDGVHFSAAAHKTLGMAMVPVFEGMTS